MNRPPACLRFPEERGNNESYWSGLKEMQVKEAEHLEEIESEFQQKLRQKDRAHGKAIRQKADSQIRSKNAELVARVREIRRLKQQIEDQVQYTAEIEQAKLTLERQMKQLQKCIDQSTQKLHSKVVSRPIQINGDHQNSPVPMHWRNGGRVYTSV